MNSRTHVFKRLALNMTAKDYYWAEKNGWFKWYTKEIAIQILDSVPLFELLKK